MAIVLKGDFKPSDPFNIYKDRANPLDPKPLVAPVDPQAEAFAREQAAAQQANQQTQQDFEQLESEKPGQYQVIDETGLDAWQQDWQAKQPGWLEDTARILGGSIAKGTGMTVSGLGNAITALTNSTTTPIINNIFGTDYGKANPLAVPGEWVSSLGEKVQEGVSFATREAIANSTPGGDLLDPSSWTLGEAPSLVGYGALTLDVFGQMAPVIAASIAAGPAGGAIVGGLQGGGGASQQAEALIDQMASQPGLLEKESAFYREQIAAGKTADEALLATKAAAGQTAFILTAPISGLGGFATAKIIDPATVVLAGRNIAARIAGKAGLSALEEGTQEAAESVATNLGTNIGAGTDVSLTEGTFADFMLGALAGGGTGAVAGAFGEGQGALGGAAAPASPMGAPTSANNAQVAPVAAASTQPAAATPSGPMTRALEHGLQNAPSPEAGRLFVVNDPALPGMGAGPANGQTVTMSPNQAGLDPNMRRVTLEDGSERILGMRLLSPIEVDGSTGRAKDPQNTTTPLATSPTMGGKPDAGSRVMVNAPGMAPFNARIEQYVTGEESAEALVIDDNGEVLQIPVEFLSSKNLTDEQIRADEAAENPPVPREPVPAGPTVRQIEGAALQFPDPTHAELFDLAQQRRQFQRLNRATGEGQLATDGTRTLIEDFAPEERNKIADALGILPKRVGPMADEYLYWSERAAKDAESGLPQNLPPVDAAKLAEWRAEREKQEGYERKDASGPATPTSITAPASPGVDDAAWWNELPPGARTALLAAASVKRSPGTSWDKFSRPIKAKLAALRVEQQAFDRPSAGPMAPQTEEAAAAENEAIRAEVAQASRDDDAASEADARKALGESRDPFEAETAAELAAMADAPRATEPPSETDQALLALETEEEVRDAVPRLLSLGEGRNFPDQEDYIVDQAVERWKAGKAAAVKLDEAANAAATSPTNDRPEPSQAQKEAGNYALGHHRLGGLDLSIENPAGSERKGVDKGGKAWSVKMKSHYGYIKGTVGKDKDHIDVFVKPGTANLVRDDMVYVVDQVQDGKLDEHKVMLGFNSLDEAQAAYLANYTKGWRGLGGISGATLAEFKQWLKSGQTSKPFGTLTTSPTAEEANPWMEKEAPAPASAKLSPAARPAKAAAKAPGLRVERYPVAPNQHEVVGEFNQIFDWVNALPEAEYRRLADGYDGAVGIRREVLNSSMPMKLWRQMKEEIQARTPDTSAPKADAEAPKGDAFANNKLFTADKVTAAKARLKAKMGQLNSGIDPEVLVDGMTIAGAYIEAGIRDFSEYATAMTGDFGDRIKPYLLSFWEGARNYPGLDTKGMTPADESARLHGGMVKVLPVEEAAPLGQEMAKPAKRTRKTGRGGDRTLINDFGVEHIDGWTSTADGEGIDTDFGMKGGVKDAFLRDATAYLKAVVVELQERGYTPADDAKGRATKPVSVNESGPATSGDVMMTMRDPDTGAAVYVHIGASSLRGTVPTTTSGVSIMFRAGVDTDRYATRAGNNWAPTDLSASDFATMLHEAAGRAARAPLAKDKQATILDLKALIARPALTPAVEPAADEVVARSEMGRPDNGRVESAPGERGDAPQRRSAQADNRDLEADQPDLLAPLAGGGTGGEAGIRPAAANVAGSGRADEGRDAGNGRTRAGGAQPVDAGTRDRSEPRAGSAAGDAGTGVKAPETVSPANKGPGNFHIADPLAIVGGGQVARFDKNKAAIELSNTLREESRHATREEQAVLAGYTGWGSFGQDLFQGTWERPRPKEGWEARDKWLRANLGQSEWESLQRSIVNAHYTDPPTVMAMWAMAQRMGFAGGRVLEPSMGIGNFFGMMPAALQQRSGLTGVELEQVTGEMAKQLYPDANISIMGYQDSKTPDNFYDLVIGNWPFADVVMADRRYNRLSPVLHDYFFLKAMDQVRPGGLVMGITSKGTMDKKESVVRTELAKKGELVAAFRLPSGAFQQYAGTAVVTDIIILRKRAEPAGMVSDAGWIKSVPFMTPSGKSVDMNEYYVNNPDHIVGTVDFGQTMYRPGMIVNRPDNMEAQLERITALVPADAYKPDTTAAKAISYITNHTDDREGALTRGKDGTLQIVRGEHLVAAADVVKYALKSDTATQARTDQLNALIDMRKAYAELISNERNQAADPEPSRKALNKLYKAFTAAHGSLSDSFGLAYLRRIEDPFYASLAALETVDGSKITPAGILTASTTRAPRKIDNPSVSDAFVLARNASVNPSLEQIAELAKSTPDAVRKALLDSGAVFELPNGDVAPADIYLSGNVREKMRQARAGLEAGNTAMERNIKALEKVMPPDVPYFNIEVQFGASWVPTQQYAEYVAHMLGVSSTEGIDVTYNAGRWRVQLADSLKSRPEASANFGTPVYSFFKLVNAAISNQTVVIRSKPDRDGATVVLAEETAEANNKIENIRTTFGQWLWSDTTRRYALEAEYNEVRNAFATPSFDGSFLSFEGMALSLGNGPFDLRQHQVNAIWRAIVTRRSLNAHEVGTGKTFTMGGIAVESRRYGIAKKPLIFAHNANSKTVAAEIQQMYPGAKVLYIDNLAPAQIDVRMRQIANDDWDAVVVPHSLIDRFSLTEETLMALAAEEIAALEAEAYAAASDDGTELTAAMFDDEDAMKKVRSPTAKQLVKTRSRIIENIKKQAQRASKEGALSFEELGVDQILVDEVHEFKKPPFSTRMRIKGLNTQSSNKSIALAFLTKYIRGMNNGGNVHLFTGAPVTNTLTEVFHAMRYIMAEEMADSGVDQWDGWFGSFAKEVQDVELNAAAEYEAVTRLAGFINVPELRRMIGQYMDVVFSEDMPEMQPRRTATGKTLDAKNLTESERAELLNGRTENAKDRPYKKVINDTADLTPEQARAFAEVQQYAAEWRSMTGKQKKDVMAAGGPQSPIIYEGLAAKASFDVRLTRGQALAGYEGRAKDNPNSKASRVVKNAAEIYRSHKKATQVIFTNSGISTTASRSVGETGDKSTETYKVFSTVRDIIERLVAEGIPRDQIATVDGSTSKDKRKAIADAMNRAEIRVVIGSTGALGVGVNMQKNLRAMHQMDAPWMPGDLEQRNGRGQRQGNQWNTVLEYRYLTDRIDGRRWQVLAIKQRFILAFLKADDKTRIIEGDAASDDEGDILTTFSEAAGDPRVLIRAKLQKKIEQLKNRERLYETGIVDAENSAKRLERFNAEDTKEIAKKQPIADKIDAVVTAIAGDGFKVTIGGKVYAKRGDATEALEDLVVDKDFKPGMAPTTVGAIEGYSLQLRWGQFDDVPKVGLVVDGDVIEGGAGTLAALQNALRSYRERVEKMAPQIAERERSIERLRESTKLPFHQAAEMERVSADYLALEADMAANPVPPPAWLRQGAPVDTEVIWKGDTHVVTGHRWDATGWYVLASGDKAPMAMPYADVTDRQGMPLYEPRDFTPPEVLDKVKKPDAPAKKDDGNTTIDDAVMEFSPAPTGKAFERWFGSSKVVDEDGKPKVVYHGASVWTEPGSRTGKMLGNFDVFNRMAGVEIVGHQPSMDTVGSWFSSEPDENGAGMYIGSKGALYPVFLAIKNPWKPPSFDAFLDKMHQTAGRDPAKQNPKGRGSAEELRAWLKKEGYDGILFPKGMQVDGNKQEVWVALDPSQIKSAIGNRGTFDPENPDIRYDVTPDGWGVVETLPPTITAAEQAELTDIVKTVSGLDDVRWYERIKVKGGNENWGTTADMEAAGFYDPSTDIVALTTQWGNPSTAYHEAFHRLQWVFLNDAEKRTLADHAGELREMLRSHGHRPDSQIDAMAGSELEADAFGLWASGALDGKPPSGLFRAWHNIKVTLRRAVNYLVGLGYQIPEDIFARAKSGEIAARAPRPSSIEARQRARASSRKFSMVGDMAGAVRGKMTLKNAAEEIAGKLTDLKPTMLAAIPLNYFAELKRPGMVAVDQYLKVKRFMDAYRGEKHAQVDTIAQQWRKYAGIGFGGANAEGKTKAAALADLMHKTTLAGVDPSLTDEETVKKAGYEALRAEYLSLNPQGQALYRTVRDSYKEQADEVDAILLENVKKTQEIAFRRAEDKYREALAENEASTKSKLDKSLAERKIDDTFKGEMARASATMKARMTKLRLVFEASRVPAPYFPLGRFGRYFVSVKDLDGNVLSFSKRESEADRRRLERDMKEAFPTARVESGLLPENSGARDMMDPRIVAEIETLLGDAGVDAKVMDMIWQRYLESMPDLSARKRFIHRKGVAGFEGDALRIFAHNQFHAAHQMARLKFGLELQELANQSIDQARKSDDPVRGMVLANELQKRHDWVMNPTGSKAVQAVTSTMFVWYLAATPAAAVVNMTQTPMMGIPILGARLGGIGKATKAIGKASLDIVRGKGSVTRSNLTADEKRAMAAFYESGMIDRTQAHDLAGVGEVGVAYSPMRHKIMAVISWAYHNVEVWNREVTALAAYRMAREIGHHEGKAIDIAHDLTWAAHFDYSNSSRPRMMQGDTAKLLLVFQSHQVNMWYRLFRDIHQAVKGESPQARKEARYQLAGMMGMMTLFAGVTGLFGYNVLIALAGMVFDDDDDPRAFKEEFEGYIVDLFGKDIGGVILKGAPGHFTKIDLTSRLGMPDFFVRAPMGGSEGRDWFQDLLVGAMGVVPSTILSTVDGIQQVASGEVSRGVETMAPKAIKDLMQAWRYANEGVLNRKGDVMLDRQNVDPWDVISEAVGFTPAKVAETYDRIGTLKDAESRVMDERRQLMNRFALAYFAGDEAAKDKAVDAIIAWNQKPYAAAVPITSKTLKASLSARQRSADKREEGALISDPELSQILREGMPQRMY